MNTKKKIEQYLRAAPKPPAPDDLLDRLKEDVAMTEVRKHSSALRIWFAPAGGQISLWRVAAAAVIAIIVMLPLSYGAAKVIKRFTIFKHTFEYPGDEEGKITYTVISSSSKEDIQNLKEFGKLYREGKAKEIKPGKWQVTLSNGKSFVYGGRHPELAGLMDTEEAKQILKKEFDEIEELRKAGKFEKIYKPEHDFVEDGVKYRFFTARYTLSNGEVIIIGCSEPVKDEDKQ